ncbi:unnamed protein product [Orchesella dallaii]|uniref:Odorant receptor n=1 Tax=Orchesella dallaii TaxID=48710 RepID=A0ABP1Q0T3_9HEXA
MSITRRRSTSSMLDRVNSPLRINVASQQVISCEHELDLNSNDFSDRHLRTDSIETASNTPLTTIFHEPSQPHNVLDDLENLEQLKSKHYLENYFKFLHFLGLASFREYLKKKLSAIYVIQKTLFWLVSGFAVLDAAKLIKLHTILLVTKGDLYRYVINCRYVLTFVQRTYFVANISTGSKLVLKTLNELAQFAASWNKSKSTRANIFTILFGLMTLLAAIIAETFGWVTVGLSWVWSASDCVLDHSFDMGLAIFVWTANSTKIDLQYSSYMESYGSSITPTTLTLGITSIWMGSIGSFMDYVISDVMFLSAITLSELTDELRLKMVNHDSTVDEILQLYKELQNLSNSIEDTYGGLFKIAHASNLFSCANILVILLVDTEYEIRVILLVLQILKVGTTYYLTINIAAVNKSLRRWVRNKIPFMNLEMKLNAYAVLDESMESPVGLGSDTFYIDEIFVLKFVTMVGTFSLFLTENKRKSVME